MGLDMGTGASGMTDEELMAIGEHTQNFLASVRPSLLIDTAYAVRARQECATLMAEVQRLRMENTALRSLATSRLDFLRRKHRTLRKVLSTNAALRACVRQVLASADEAGNSVRCGFCGGSDIGIGAFGTHHTEDCPRNKLAPS